VAGHNPPHLQSEVESMCKVQSENDGSVPAWQLYPLLHISDLRVPMCTGNHAIWEVVVIEMEAKQ